VPPSLLAEPPPSSPVPPELFCPELDGDPELEGPELDGDPELEGPELVPELVPPELDVPALDSPGFVPLGVPVPEPVVFSPAAQAPRIATHDASIDREAQEPIRTEAQEPIRTTVISCTSM
jgi:hypothetical protein